MVIGLNSIVLYVLLIIVCWCYYTESYVSRGSIFRQCETPVLKNGQVRLRQRGKLIRYQCAPTFSLYGDRYSACLMGRWEHPVPICIKAGCEPIPKIENGLIALLNNDASALLFCNPGFVAAGSPVSFCDGKQWDRSIGRCRETQVEAETWCDFESSTICDWSLDPSNDFEWKRKSGDATTKQLRTGPKHDHTVMIPLEGFFMVAEVTDILSSDAARLLSPIYEQKLSKDACFKFFYHMFGFSVGKLRVYIKPITLNLENILEDPRYLLFQVQGSQKNQWLEGLFPIEEVEDDFQIIIEATAGRSRLSDIAIDDVALLQGAYCITEQFQTTESVTEEDGGIYDIQSCTNRCNETQPSLSVDTVTVRQNGKTAIIEKCDCHSGCEDLKSCCLDYRSICVFGPDEFSTVNVNTDTPKPVTRPIQTSIATTKSTASEIPTTQKIFQRISMPSKIKVTGIPINYQTLIHPKIIKMLSTSTTPTPKLNFTKTTAKVYVPTTETLEYQVKARVLPMQRVEMKPTISTKIPTVLPDSSKQTYLIKCLIIAAVIGGSILAWIFVVFPIWSKYRHGPINYKTKYYCEKTQNICENSDSDNDEHDKDMPVMDSKTSNGKERKMNNRKVDEYSDVRFLTSEDELLDFSVQEH